MIVVDVNVIAYLLIEGEHTASAEEVLLADPEWAVPLLWRSEWRNVLAGYVRRGELDRAGALGLIEAAERLVVGREYLPEGSVVMALVDASTASAYDCEYVALAEVLDVPLVTNAGVILKDFPGRAVRPEELAAPS